jgi:hypothetical protein
MASMIMQWFRLECHGLDQHLRQRTRSMDQDRLRPGDLINLELPDKDFRNLDNRTLVRVVQLICSRQ